MFKSTIILGIFAPVCFAQTQWNQVTPKPSFRTHQEVIFVDSQFISVGNYEEVMVSKNGSDWTLSLIGHDCNLQSIAFGKQTYVAVGNSCIYTSTDLKNWTSQSRAPEYPVFTHVAFGHDRFVAVGMEGAVYSSPDGKAWTKQTSFTTNNLERVDYQEGVFIAGGWYGTIITSADGSAWHLRQDGETSGNDIQAFSYGNSTYVAVGSGGISYSSLDAITWTKHATPVTKDLWDCIYAENQFLAVGQQSVVLTSPDGLTWSEHTNSYSSSSMMGVAYAKDVYVVAGTAMFYSRKQPSSVRMKLNTSTQASRRSLMWDLNGRLQFIE